MFEVVVEDVSVLVEKADNRVRPDKLARNLLLVLGAVAGSGGPVMLTSEAVADGAVSIYSVKSSEGHTR